MEDCLTCPICFEKFDFERNMPMILSCGHSLCLVCVEKLGSTNSLSCPQDRLKEHRQISDIPKNYSLLHILERQKAAPTGDMCGVHTNKKVKFFCLSCRKGLCSSCIVLHQQHEWIDTSIKEAQNAVVYNLLHSIQYQFQQSLSMLGEFENARNCIEFAKQTCISEIKDKFNRLKSKLESKEKELIAEIHDNTFGPVNEFKKSFNYAQHLFYTKHQMYQKAEQIYSQITSTEGTQKIEQILALDNIAHVISTHPVYLPNLYELPAIKVETKVVENNIKSISIGKRQSEDLGQPTKRIKNLSEF